MQCVSVSFSVLQCVAVFYNVLQCVAVLILTNSGITSGSGQDHQDSSLQQVCCSVGNFVAECALRCVHVCVCCKQGQHDPPQQQVCCSYFVTECVMRYVCVCVCVCVCVLQTRLARSTSATGMCQSVASVYCSVLQRVAVCCSVLQCVAVCCSVLQCVAVCCSVLQC